MSNSRESSNDASDFENFRSSERHLNNQQQKASYVTRSRSAPHGTDSEEVSKHVKNLAFRNPGKFMDNFDPERSGREMRKMNRRIYRDTTRRYMYDEEGHLMADGSDICDCLDDMCPGCHFPCTKCGSQKCGGDCRCNRRWYYQEMEIEGTNQKITFIPPVESQ